MIARPARQVFLIEDDGDVRDALTLLLRTSGFTVDAFASAVDFLATRERGRTGCVVADIRMPGLSGLQLLERLAADTESLPVVIITGHGDVVACRRAFRAGAVDFLTKPVEEDTLIEAVETGLARLQASHVVELELVEGLALLDTLSPREREILDLIARGFSTKEIARALDLSPRTVESHRANLGQKLGTHSVAEMVRLVLTHSRRGDP